MDSVHVDLWRRAAVHAHKILRGANPGELPVERLTQFDLVVTLQTARQLRARGPQFDAVTRDPNHPVRTYSVVVQRPSRHPGELVRSRLTGHYVY